MIALVSEVMCQDTPSPRLQTRYPLPMSVSDPQRVDRATFLEHTYDPLMS